MESQLQCEMSPCKLLSETLSFLTAYLIGSKVLKPCNKIFSPKYNLSNILEKVKWCKTSTYILLSTTKSPGMSTCRGWTGAVGRAEVFQLVPSLSRPSCVTSDEVGEKRHLCNGRMCGLERLREA